MASIAGGLAVALLVWALAASSLASCGGGVEQSPASQPSVSGSASVPDTSGSGSSTTGAPPSVTTGELTAKQAMDLLLAKAREWAGDAVPVVLGAVPRGKTVDNGLCNYWSGSFYSPSLGQVYVFSYFKDAYTPQPHIGRAGKPLYENVSWQVGDLLGAWKIDSPEAAKIASEQGVAEVTGLEVSVRRIQPDHNPPSEVPESCLAFWRVEGEDGKTIYLDAASGEVLQ